MRIVNLQRHHFAAPLATRSGRLQYAERMRRIPRVVAIDANPSHNRPMYTLHRLANRLAPAIPSLCTASRAAALVFTVCAAGSLAHAAETKAPLSFSDGHETDSRDGGRPVVL